MATTNTKPRRRRGPASVQDADRHVGARMRERRITLGITQPQMAELIGVTAQQVNKYESGINRIAAGRLEVIAHALDVEVSYLFKGIDSDLDFKPNPMQRKMFELARNFISLPSKEKAAFCNLVRVLAGGEDMSESGNE